LVPRWLGRSVERALAEFAFEAVGVRDEDGVPDAGVAARTIGLCAIRRAADGPRLVAYWQAA
jgi:hypothetical protein